MRGGGVTARLRQEGLEVRFERLDVKSDASVRRCRDRLAKNRWPVDVLVNNAGVYTFGEAHRVAPRSALVAFDVNTVGALRCSQAWLPGMKRRGYGRIVNVSSGWGSFAERLEGTSAAYCMSKAAMNALTVRLARAANPPDIKINCVCPGWVRTRMGGAGADLSAEEGVDTVVWLATLPKSGPTGGFYRERKRVAW